MTPDASSKQRLKMTMTLKESGVILNPRQREAVEHKNGPLLIIAGAGTGKTSVITERIAHILRQGWARHSQVLTLTFTKKAITEIEERVDRLMPLGYEAIPIHNFHSFCEAILREFGADIGISGHFTILNGAAHWLLLKEHLYELDLDYYRPLGNPTFFIGALTGVFGRFKEELVSPQEVLDLARKKMGEANDPAEETEAKRLAELGRVYAQYQALLEENDAFDFADLHYQVIELLTKRPNIEEALQNRYKYILVDEYQDTNIAQNTLVNRLAAGHGNLTVVGDDDQSIYKFRGAAISNILQFQKTYPDAKTVVLTENYRSNQAILDFSYASIQHNNPDRLEVTSAVDKRLTSRRPGTEEAVRLIHCSTLDQEVEYVLKAIQRVAEQGIALSDIAVLCRANAYAYPFVEAFKRHNIPYDFVSEKGLFSKEEVRDLTAVLRVLSNPTDDLSLYRVLRMPFFKLSMETIVTQMAEAKKSYRSLWKQLQGNPEARFLTDTFKDLLEYSKRHTAGETLYRFTDTVQLYEQLLKKGTIEAQEQIVTIAAFFNQIATFERGSPHRSVADFVTYLELLEEAESNPAATAEAEEREGVFVSTIHGAKGLEFHTVFLPSLAARRFPSDNRADVIPIPDELVHEILADSEPHLQEERRLFYVAVTRAKEALHLLHSDFYGPSASAAPRKKKRSRFIDEVIDTVAVAQQERTVRGVDRFLKPKTPDFDPEAFKVSRQSRIIRFSYSQLRQFKECPRQYQYQYLLRIPQPPNGNLSFGSTMHNTLQEFYTAVAQSKQASLFTDFEPDISLDRLLAIYELQWIDRGYESKAHMEARKERGREILVQFYDRFKQDIPRVRFLEKGFTLKIGDYSLTGRIDRADDLPDGTLEIIDYKTGKVKDQKYAESDLQIFIYALAAQECFSLPASRLTLYYLDGDEKVSTQPTPDKLKKVKEELIRIGNEINVSDFAPTPSQFTCKHCPYSRICDASQA